MIIATDTMVNQGVNNKSLSISLPFLILLAGLILLHLFCITNVRLAQLFAIIEALVVLVFLVQKKVSTAVLLFGIFILTSYDSKFFFAVPVGVEEVFHVASLPFGISVYFYLLLSIIVFAFSLHNILRCKLDFNNLLVKFAIFTLIVVTCMGVFSVISDGFSFIAITRDIKDNVMPSLWVISFFFLFYTNKNFVYKYERLIIHVLLAYILVGLITSLTGFLLVRGTRPTILYLPLASFFFTTIILFSNEVPNKKDKIIIAIFFAISVYLQLFFDSCLNGKSWLVFISVIAVELYLFARKSVISKISSVLIVILLFGALSSKIVSYINNTENGKLLEFISLFEGAQSGNLDDVDDSAQFRFLEFITISDYYRNHPQFLLLGKGLGGGVPNAGFFVYSETAFSDDQYNNNSFSVMHESLNVVYLKCGLVGLVFFILVLFDGLKKIKFSPLFYIGCIWIFFYWAYSISLLFLGLPAFLIAYQKLEYQKKQL